MPILNWESGGGGGGDLCGPWPIDDLACFNVPDGTDPELIDKWQQVATDRLWAASGRRWGLCSRTIRPCLKSCSDWAGLGISWGTYGYVPYVLNGQWYNASPCGCGGDCSCGELCEVFLPGPFHAVTEVKIDGAVLDPVAYRVDQTATGPMLVRQDGGCWPSCQAMGLPAGEVGTFTVEYEYGVPLTADAVAAVSEYTAELVKKCLPGCDCRLTDIDLEEAAAGGLTGLPSVDGWIRSVNPYGLPEELRVLSPDSGWSTPRQTVWP